VKRFEFAAPSAATFVKGVYRTLLHFKHIRAQIQMLRGIFE